MKLQETILLHLIRRLVVIRVPQRTCGREAHTPHGKTFSKAPSRGPGVGGGEH